MTTFGNCPHRRTIAFSTLLKSSDFISIIGNTGSTAHAEFTGNIRQRFILFGCKIGFGIPPQTTQKSPAIIRNIKGGCSITGPKTDTDNFKEFGIIGTTDFLPVAQKPVIMIIGLQRHFNITDFQRIIDIS